MTSALARKPNRIIPTMLPQRWAEKISSHSVHGEEKMLGCWRVTPPAEDLGSKVRRAVGPPALQ